VICGDIPCFKNAAEFSATLDFQTINMKRPLIKIIYWLVTFLILLIPVLAMLKYNTKEYLDVQIPSLGVAVIIFIYLFIIFKYARPRIEDLFERKHRKLIAKIDELFTTPERLSESIKQKDFWDGFFEKFVGGFAAKFEIPGAYCFMLNKDEKKFIAAFGIGEKIPDAEIPLDAPLIQLISDMPGILYKSNLSSLGKVHGKGAALEYFIKNSIEVVLPCLNPEKQIIGFIALGPLSGNKTYSKSFLSALDLYRIQFQQKLANALMLEQARTEQVIAHDQMVVGSVKSKIIPRNMAQLNGYRISFLHINNSLYGGDYLDSVRLDENRVGLFISDTSYSGIDSAVVSLELYAVLHSHTKSFSSPDKVLSLMNWIITSSKFTNKFTPAQCVILSTSGEISFSNAAFNPLILYDPDDNTIANFGTKGIPIGMDKKSTFESSTIQLKSGAIGVLYSHGLVSAVDDGGKPYSIERVKNLVRSNTKKSPADLAAIINSDITGFIKEKKQVNDMSAIIFKFQ
jgi:serine phosphatase RsbU (regulator of sigma subunit)